MNAIEFSKLLKSLGACTDARLWAKGKSLAEFWQTCDRGDWLLWLCARMIGKSGWPTHQEIVLTACDCAELSLKYVQPGEDRPRIAIEIARKWACGEAKLGEVLTARAAAADAAHAAADAAHAVAAAHAAAAAAAYAAAAADAADYAAHAARVTTYKQCTDLVRARLHPTTGPQE